MGADPISIGLGVASLGAGIFGLANSMSASDAQKQAGKYQQTLFNANADVLDQQAKDAINLGGVNAENYNTENRQTVGKQVAGFASQGVDVNSQTAQTTTKQTTEQGMLDVLSIKDNAWRTAWGYGQQAQDDVRQGTLAAMGGNAQAASTLATGGLGLANSVIQGTKYAFGKTS